MNLPAIIFNLVLFGILMGFFSQRKIDYFPIALLVGALSVISMLMFFDVKEDEIL